MKKIISVFFAVILMLMFCSCSEENVYVIGTDKSMAPFCSLDKNNTPAGFDIDLLNEISKTEGFNIEFKPMGFLESLDMLENGELDAVIAAIIPTDEFNEKFDFSDLYYNSEFAMAVKKDKNKELIDMFNDGLVKIIESGEYKKLLKKYSLEGVSDYE